MPFAGRGIGVASKAMMIFGTSHPERRQIQQTQKNCGDFSVAAVCKSFDFLLQENRIN
jgi:hypothetical protein